MNTTLIRGPGVDGSEAAAATPPTALTTESRNIEDPSKPITAAALAEILSGGPNESGQNVTANTSMGVSAVFACVRIIATAIARMPLIVYERTETGRERATSHPLYRLLRLRPNSEMSAFSFTVAVIANALLHGGGFAEIVRTRGGRVGELVPIEAWRVKPFRRGGELRFTVTHPEGDVELLQRDVLHLPGLSFDGVCGLSVVQYARLTLGAVIAGNKFNASIAGNGMRPSMVLTSPKRLGKEAAENLRISLQKLYGGPGNAGKPMILEEGIDASQLTMPLKDAEWVLQQQFDVEEVCRWFGVPPHKVQHLLRSTNNNIEQQSLDFLGDCLGPWVELEYQEFNWKLFGPEEQDHFYCERLTQAIVMLDTDTRGKHYERMARIAAMTPDEIRQRENMNDLPDQRGTVATIQGSQIPAPTPEEAVKLLEAWTAKGSGGSGKGQPNPKVDDKVAGAG